MMISNKPGPTLPARLYTFVVSFNSASEAVATTCVPFDEDLITQVEHYYAAHTARLTHKPHKQVAVVVGENCTFVEALSKARAMAAAMPDPANCSQPQQSTSK